MTSPPLSVPDAPENDELYARWKKLVRAGEPILVAETLWGEALVQHIRRIDCLLQETGTPVTVIYAP
jgi:hypothetical protein